MDNQNHQEDYFRFQLDLLMKEIDLIDNAIGRLDELLLRNRNWGTTLWAGAIAIILKENLDKVLALVVAVLPILFWFIDIRWKMAILQCSNRQKKIAAFLNSNALQESFEMNRISPENLDLFDPIGSKLSVNQRKYFIEAICYKDTPIFFPIQILFSLLVFCFR